jgi:hypothetical protein
MALRNTNKALWFAARRRCQQVCVGGGLLDMLDVVARRRRVRALGGPLSLLQANAVHRGIYQVFYGILVIKNDTS